MNIIFSDNNGEYLNKTTEKTISASSKDIMQESNKNVEEKTLVNSEED